MPEQKPCPFCEIDQNRNRIMYDGARVFVMLSNPRLMEGHLLIIPKVHVGSLSDLRRGERAELLDTAAFFQEKIKKVFTQMWGLQAGCDLSQHDRGFMPTTALSVPQHLHIHLRPRFWKDAYYEEVLKYETAVFQPLPDDEREKIHKLLI